MRTLLSVLLLLSLCSVCLADSPGKALSKFGFKYFQQQSGEGNLVVSPFSIHAAFAMLTLGAEGGTRTEALKVLGLQEEFGPEYAQYLSELRPSSGKLSLASRVWPSADLELSKQFLEDSVAAFGAEPELLNYQEPEKARAKINNWVSERTEQMIEELVPVNALQSDTEIILSNALYFEGQWSTPFKEQNTEAADFHCPDRVIQVPMMSQKMPATYSENQNFELVSLSYSHSDLAMAFLLPKDKDGLQAAKSKVGTEALRSLEDEAKKYSMDEIPTIHLSLPKFKVSQSSKPIPLLKSLGLNSLLGASPDLSHLGGGGLTVTDCFHEAVVEVDEKGTKASAATAVILSRSIPQIQRTVRLDRPFFFVIYHRQSLAPLFIGQVVDPTL